MKGAINPLETELFPVLSTTQMDVGRINGPDCLKAVGHKKVRLMQALTLKKKPKPMHLCSLLERQKAELK